ncbi:MAG: hypothetical protein CO189_03630 [candidate division Zixibacteria bacterium CG_4_9_14_3_um_filter_46_8]|nr:MAG: hypothetical protein CO189_03630 [candidate division Zixibacteria bacterium CG_4_9_14_3_um_filter_46_8]
MTEQKNRFQITPETKVGKMLNAYPHLEEVLIKMAPAFSKLKNPVLRKTVGKVANLHQVAQMGNISLGLLINTLRKEAGLEQLDGVQLDESVQSDRPEWLDLSRIVNRLDARTIIEQGGHPMGQVMNDINQLKDDEIYELTTPFVPAPLVDMAKGRGFVAWSFEKGPELVKTYFKRN